MVHSITVEALVLTRMLFFFVEEYPLTHSSNLEHLRFSYDSLVLWYKNYCHR